MIVVHQRATFRCVGSRMLPVRAVGLPAQLVPDPRVEQHSARARFLREDC